MKTKNKYGVTKHTGVRIRGTSGTIWRDPFEIRIGRDGTFTRSSKTAVNYRNGCCSVRSAWSWRIYEYRDNSFSEIPNSRYLQPLFVFERFLTFKKRPFVRQNVSIICNRPCPKVRNDDLFYRLRFRVAKLVDRFFRYSPTYFFVFV